MATTLYVNPDPATEKTRAAKLGLGYMPAVPPQYANLATAPCVILAGGGLAPVVLPESATLAQVTTALGPILAVEQTAATAAAQVVANAATIQAALLTRLGQIEAWLAANPSGAALTNAQTLTVGKMLAQLARLLLQVTSTVGQAN